MTLNTIGMLSLAVYLILVGFAALFQVAVPALFIGIVALVAGILILIVTLRGTP